MKIFNIDIHSLFRFFRVLMRRAGADGIYILIALLMLGGVTEFMLQRANIPVLLAH